MVGNTLPAGDRGGGHGGQAPVAVTSESTE